MTKLKINFTGFEEGKLYRQKDCDRNGIAFKIVNGELFFVYPNVNYEGWVDFYDMDINSLLESEFEEVIPRIKLTEMQRKRLEGRLEEGFEWIARDRYGNVYCYIELPYKDSLFWRCEGLYSLIIGEFNFLKWEDENPMNIKELLEKDVI